MLDLQTLSLQDLLALETAIKSEILKRRRDSEAKLIEEIRQKAALLGLTSEDLIARISHTPATKRPKVAAQYRHPETKAEWSGRGRKPKWFEAWLAEGRSIDELRI